MDTTFPIAAAVATWATRPNPAAVPVGSMFRATDLGNTIFVNMGTYWKPLGGSMVLGQSGIPFSLTGTTTTTNAASVVVPGGLPGPNGRVRVWAQADSTNNANSKTLQIGWRGTSSYMYLAGLTGLPFMSVIGQSQNANSESVQWNGLSNNSAGLAASSSANALSVSTINTAVDQIIDFQLRLADGSDTITLRNYSVEVLAP